jgi:hypothetical protein
MYDPEEDNDDYCRVSFTYEASYNNVEARVSRRLEDTETYSDIAQEFVYFLHAMGYNYVAGLTIHGEDGKDLYTTLF